MKKGALKKVLPLLAVAGIVYYAFKKGMFGAGATGPATFILPQGAPGAPGILPVPANQVVSRFNLLQRLAMQVLQSRYKATMGSRDLFLAANKYANTYKNSPSVPVDANFVSRDPNLVAIANQFGARA